MDFDKNKKLVFQTLADNPAFATVLRDHRETIQATIANALWNRFGGKAWGAETDVYYMDTTGKGFSGLGKLRTQYALWPDDEVIQSHDPVTFSAIAEYPPELQERPYDRDELEQHKVIRNAQMLEPILTINSNPDAVNGPPIITQDGYVLAGNSRVMSIKRSRTEKPGAYANYLREAIPMHPIFGLAPTDNLEDRMLVRVIDPGQDFDRKTISSILNESFTQSLTASARAVSLGKKLPPELFQSIGEWMGEGDSLSEILGSKGGKIIEMLQKKGVIKSTNYGEFTKSRGGKTSRVLSVDGRQTIRLAIMGALIDDRDVLSLASVRLEKFYASVAPILVAMEYDPDVEKGGYSLLEPFRQGARAVSLLGVSTLTAFQGKFRTGEADLGEGNTMATQYRALFENPLAAYMAKWIAAAQESPRLAYDAMSLYFRLVPGAKGTMIMDDFTPEQVRMKALPGKTKDGAMAFPFADITLAGIEEIGVVRWLRGATDRDPRRENPSTFSPDAVRGCFGAVR